MPDDDFEPDELPPRQAKELLSHVYGDMLDEDQAPLSEGHVVHPGSTEPQPIDLPEIPDEE